MNWKIFNTIFLLTFIFGCQTYSESDKETFDSKIKSYLSQKGIACSKSNSGLHYKIINPGEGAFIKYQDSLQFTYKASLLNGKTVDEQKEQVQFAVKDLIAAWKEIVLELKPGAEVFMIAPPQLAYGEYKLDSIPENSILQFEMKILGVK
jgi:FKBP-type peptidyl-prolyl cis-trans isomerase FkpA